MTLQSLNHGTNSLALTYGLTLLGLVLILIKKRVPAGGVLVSPILAVPCFLGGALLTGIVTSALGIHGATVTWASTMPGIAAYLLAGIVGGLFFARKRVLAEIHKRGTVIQSGGNAPKARSSAVTLAGVEIPAIDETKHFKLLGTTGSGKSTAIRELLTGALARGDRAIIADPDGGYLARFYDAARGDVILNPFDARSARWDLFGEIDKPHDVEQLARSLIPEGADDSGREWRAYARTYLSAVIEYCKLEDHHDIGELWRLIAVADTDELKDLLAGTAAQPFLADGAAKMFHSIRGTASPALSALKYLKNSAAPPLSVRQWVRQGKGVLFLPYSAGEIAALRNLIATWLRLAIFETMTGAEGDRHL